MNTAHRFAPAPPAMPHYRVFLGIVLALLTSGAVMAESDPRARPLADRYGPAVLSVQAVAQVDATADVSGTQRTMPTRDIPVQGVATIVSNEGILVSALSFFDQTAAMTGQVITGPQGQRARLEVTGMAINEVKFVLVDGTEIPGEVLLKDEVLDLIVLRADRDAWAQHGADKLQALDLSQAGEAEAMDEIVVLGQTGPALGRAPLMALPGIMVKMTRPRTVYRPSYAQKGGPALTLDGKVLGIGAQLVYQEKLTNDLVVIPAADVAELVRQALNAAPVTGGSSTDAQP